MDQEKEKKTICKQAIDKALEILGVLFIISMLAISPLSLAGMIYSSAEVHYFNEMKEWRYANCNATSVLSFVKDNKDMWDVNYTVIDSQTNIAYPWVRELSDKERVVNVMYPCLFDGVGKKCTTKYYYGNDTREEDRKWNNKFYVVCSVFFWLIGGEILLYYVIYIIFVICVAIYECLFGKVEKTTEDKDDQNFNEAIISLESQVVNPIDIRHEETTINYELLDEPIVVPAIPNTPFSLKPLTQEAINDLKTAFRNRDKNKTLTLDLK